MVLATDDDHDAVTSSITYLKLFLVIVCEIKLEKNKL